MTEELFEVFDRGQPIDFLGKLLGSSTSYTPGKPRWFEVRIFRTHGGKWVVSGVGRSVVAHRPACSRVKDKSAPEPATADSVECDTCWPDLASSDLVIHETDREWTQVSDDPGAVIERLRLRDADGVFYLPRTSQIALNQAAAADSTMADALLAPMHVE